jgi:AraC-like DNA-binding protein
VTFSALNLLQLILSCLALLLGMYVISLRRPMALASFLFVMSLHSGVRAFRETLDYSTVAYSYTLGFLYGPLIFLTLLDILRSSQNKLLNVLHFIPFILSIVSLKFAMGSMTVMGTVLCLLSLGYLIASFRVLSNFVNAVEHTRSSAMPREVFWLRRVVDIFAILVLYQCCRFILGLVVSETIRNVFEFGFFIGAVLFFALLIFKGLRNPNMIPIFDEDERALSREMKGKSRRNIADWQNKLIQKLNHLMAEEKPFLDPEISVKSLSRLMDINDRQLSVLINDGYGYSFSELINRARVNEAEELMRNDIQQACTLLEIAMDAGFNSKSSFNHMFKRYTQQTPSVFRKNFK